tara:strand:- start:25294 stop:25485 length:192 start_codon:yes stop_codon:yes gene_type:complete
LSDENRDTEESGKRKMLILEYVQIQFSEESDKVRLQEIEDELKMSAVEILNAAAPLLLGSETD